jgi:hypothetical protein
VRVREVESHGHSSVAKRHIFLVPKLEAPHFYFYPTVHADAELLRGRDAHDGRRAQLLCCLGLRAAV